MNHISQRPRQAGLLILGLLSVGDLAAPLLTDGETPPWAVAFLAAGLGAASLWLTVKAWQDHARPVRLLVGLRILSAVAALPAFVVDGVPAPAQVAAAASVVLTTVGVTLVAHARPAAVPA